MKEHIQNAGRKHWYGDHWVELQKETLDILQGFFSSFGACILQGCVVTNNAGTPANYDISAGLVGILHADGYKIARFAGVTNVPVTGYLTITATDIAGVYNSGAGTIAKLYTATHTATNLGAYTAYQLPMSIDASFVQDFSMAMAKYHFTEWRTFAISEPNVSGTLYVRVDKVARRLQVSGQLLVKNMGAWFSDFEEIIVLSHATLAADAVIGKWALYPTHPTVMPTTFVSSGLPAPMVEDANNKTLIMGGMSSFDGDLKVTAIRSDGNQQYYIAVKMDVDLTV